MASETVDILLVEDSDDDATFFRHALEGSGLRPRLKVARDGAEALACIFGASAQADAVPILMPRLIVLDLKLPKISGLEVLHRLKANPHTRPIPVVVLSSSQEKRDLAEGYSAGLNSYLVKPMDFDEYTALVNALGKYWLQLNQTPKP
jgi:two-component system response regulator